MNDKTIVKPRPGRRAPTPIIGEPNNATSDQQARKNKDSGKTFVFKNANSGAVHNPVLTISGNPLVDCAGNLLSLCCQLRIADNHNDIDRLRYQCVELVKSYEQELRSEGIDTQTIESSRYCICCFLDETVLNTKWGGDSSWAAESLLSTFHNETFGGEYFYTLLDDALQYSTQKYQLLELMFLCLSLGFIGKMRFAEQGERQLEDYREAAYLAVKANKADFHRELSPGWQAKVAKGVELQAGFPLWVIVSLFSAAVMFVYMGFSYSINNYSSSAYEQLTNLVPWQEDKANKSAHNRSEYILLQQHLQTEIQRGILSVEQLNDRVRIRIGAGLIFSSGSAEPRADFEVVLNKIARTLESVQGKILITGHTDDEKIFTTRYPSNWHLSLARATSIADVLARSAMLSGRLWPEGLGSNQPIVENNSAENRAINRRIEIDLLF
ncbi:type VI secretion system protein TssL, long form [Psychromonas antarctica]|uniref:type VI secretion system protein TssL, long form n=1 Tax=Psychromonas antarctica TaxID=67573 RepID=UPI001EE87C72|nr:type VI secretion system protein TssL, long form [Psychromonas antarctica]MCG6201231.1 type VI secretion system protein TssL, long form [Psychromonas antarctica]